MLKPHSIQKSLVRGLVHMDPFSFSVHVVKGFVISGTDLDSLCTSTPPESLRKLHTSWNIGMTRKQISTQADHLKMKRCNEWMRHHFEKQRKAGNNKAKINEVSLIVKIFIGIILRENFRFARILTLTKISNGALKSVFLK